MTEDQKLEPARPRTRKVSIQERSVQVGNIIVVNGYRANRALLTQRFAEGGYASQETAHFLLFTRNETPATILVHRLSPASIRKTMAGDLLEELDSLALFSSRRRRGEVLAGLIASTHFPPDVRRAWSSFGASIVQDLLVFVCASSMPLAPTMPALAAEALLYEQIAACCTGARFLIAGANVSLCALRLAAQAPSETQVVVLESSGQALSVAQELGAERHLSSMQLIQDDLGTGTLDEYRAFDTVIALHLVEHLIEADLYRMLTRLLQKTARRLVLAAPSMRKPTTESNALQQHYSHARLAAIGRWCLRQLGGAGHIRYEGVSDDLLIIEREGAAN
jgi:hypothetical protein